MANEQAAASAGTEVNRPAARRQPHPAFQLIARYGAVLGAAWGARKELAGPKRLADEAAFLPAALALQETPVHPSPRRAMWLIMALFTCTLVWSYVGELDIVAVAPGRIVVSDGTKVIQPLEAGIVKAIHVRDGSHVKAGQLLIELDPTVANADNQATQAQATATQAELNRTEMLSRAVATLAENPSIPSEKPLAISAFLSAGKAPDPQAQAEWADISARTQRLNAEIARREAEGATATQALAKLQAMLPLARQREADLAGLAEQGFVASHAGQDRTRERIELERDLATQQARVAEAQAALAESMRTRSAYLAEAKRALADRKTKAELEVQQVAQQSAKTSHRVQVNKLTSPVTGVVQQLAIRTTGGVVTPAQALMVVVPDEAEVTAEVWIENKDIGFVRAGQEAEVKVDTFNFTQYGTVEATVKSVAADAVVDERQGARFPAVLVLQRASINVNGRTVRLSPGMGVSGEVKSGRRRVIEQVLSPIQRHAKEGMRER